MSYHCIHRVFSARTRPLCFRGRYLKQCKPDDFMMLGPVKPGNKLCSPVFAQRGRRPGPPSDRSPSSSPDCGALTRVSSRMQCCGGGPPVRRWCCARALEPRPRRGGATSHPLRAGLLPSLEGWSTARHRVNLVYASAVAWPGEVSRESLEQK